MIPPECVDSQNLDCLASKFSGGKRMLEWKPRLIVLVVAIAVLAASLNGLFFVFDPSNFGWGAW